MNPFCPCIDCECDRKRNEPQVLARFRDTKRWWGPFGVHGDPTSSGFPDRTKGHAFGPRHAADLNNRLFELVPLNAEPQRTP